MFAHPQSGTLISLERTTSRITPSSATRMLAAGVALAATCLLAPGQAQAQAIGGQQALRNVSTFGPYAPATVGVTAGWTIDGAEALLGAKPAGKPREGGRAPESSKAVRPVDGAQALLARGSRA